MLPHLSLCFSMMISHKFLPPSLSKVILNPIVKDKTDNISDKDNYRPIALAICELQDYGKSNTEPM